jgi:hypothetical protein
MSKNTSFKTDIEWLDKKHQYAPNIDYKPALHTKRILDKPLDETTESKILSKQDVTKIKNVPNLSPEQIGEIKDAYNKSSGLYCCEKCAFKSSKVNDYKRHILSIKHIKKTTVNDQTEQITKFVPSIENILLSYNETATLIDNRLQVYKNQYNKCNEKVLKRLHKLENYENVNENRIKSNNNFVSEQTKLLDITNNIVDGYKNDLADVKMSGVLLKKEIKSSLDKITNNSKSEIELIKLQQSHMNDAIKKIENNVDSMSIVINSLKRREEIYDNKIVEIENTYLDKINKLENILAKFEKIIKTRQ